MSENYSGAARLNSDQSALNTLDFVVRQVLASVSTAKLVKVVAVAPGAVGPVGTVDVQPLVGQVDGVGQVTPHGVVFGLPYFRIVGGASAVILDPTVGDVGLAIFADRDTSAAKATRAPSPPGSRRVMSMADGFYVGAFLADAPTQYVHLLPDAGGVTIVSPAAITLQAPSIVLDGDVTGSGAATFDGSVTGAEIVLDTHVHGGGSIGSGTTGGPE